MNLPALTSGLLERRYKRFLADILLVDGTQITAHCPNTGAMTGCATPGSRCYYSLSDNPNRKYAATLELVETDQGLVSVNTNRANALVGEALRANRIQEISPCADVRAEVKIPQGNGRFDFFATSKGTPIYIEVKSVTLHQGLGIGAFPDAVSVRALKHLQALMQVVADGARGVLIFCAQHQGIRKVRAASEIDAEYAAGLQRAIQAGVEVYAYGCSMNLKTIVLDEPLPLLET